MDTKNVAFEILAEERVGFGSCVFASASHSLPTALCLFGIKIFIVKNVKLKS